MDAAAEDADFGGQLETAIIVSTGPFSFVAAWTRSSLIMRWSVVVVGPPLSGELGVNLN